MTLIKTKIVNLEKVLLDRPGSLQAWALAEAKARTVVTKADIAVYTEVLKKYDPSFVPSPPTPDPISDSEDPETYAKALVDKFKTEANFKEWQRARWAAGADRLQEFLSRIKKGEHEKLY